MTTGHRCSTHGFPVLMPSLEGYIPDGRGGRSCVTGLDYCSRTYATQLMASTPGNFWRDAIFRPENAALKMSRALPSGGIVLRWRERPSSFQEGSHRRARNMMEMPQWRRLLHSGIGFIKATAHASRYRRLPMQAD